ncbi:hypothetical protein [African swine fever virus]|nr:unnamed protein [African swine fever virus]WMQ66054.1 hypothetical protein [African swine fever virus]WMZ41325.1 hypothetical protein [African swine fever virus]
MFSLNVLSIKTSYIATHDFNNTTVVASEIIFILVMAYL